MLSGDSKLFLQSLTTSKMRKKNRLKNCLSYTQQKLAGLKTLGLVALWATFEAVFFYVFGGQKKFIKKKKNIGASALKSCIKWSLKKLFSSSSKFNYSIKTGIITTKCL